MRLACHEIKITPKTTLIKYVENKTRTTKMLASNRFGISHNIAFQIEIRKHLHRIGHWLKELSKKHKKADINVDYMRKVRQLKQSKKVKLAVGLKTLEDNYIECHYI